MIKVNCRSQLWTAASIGISQRRTLWLSLWMQGFKSRGLRILGRRWTCGRSETASDNAIRKHTSDTPKSWGTPWVKPNNRWLSKLSTSRNAQSALTSCKKTLERYMLKKRQLISCWDCCQKEAAALKLMTYRGRPTNYRCSLRRLCSCYRTSCSVSGRTVLWTRTTSTSSTYQTWSYERSTSEKSTN